MKYLNWGRCNKEKEFFSLLEVCLNDQDDDDDDDDNDSLECFENWNFLFRWIKQFQTASLTELKRLVCKKNWRHSS